MNTSRCDVLAGAGLLADQGTTTVNRMFGGSRQLVREEPGTAP